MGKKSRLKKLRNQVTEKLQKMGLQDMSYFVVSKEIPYKKPIYDAGGQVAKDENGVEKFTLEKFQKYTAKNAFRNLQRKIIKGAPTDIKKFLKD